MNTQHTEKQYISTWAKFVNVCTNTLGALYRSNGTVVRSPLAEKFEEFNQNIEFASLMQRTHHRLRHREMVRQINLESFSSLVSKQIGNSSSTKDIDPDWASYFFDYIQDISNETMQALWAKAMTYELAHPGSISKQSLKFLYTCDIWEISAFKKIAPFVFIGDNGHPFIFRSTADLSSEDPLFSENRLLSHCVSIGLVANQASKLTVGFGFNYLGEHKQIQRGYLPKGSETGYYIQHFTKTGSDLYKLLIETEKSTKNSLLRRQAWNFLTDFLDIDDIDKSKPV